MHFHEAKFELKEIQKLEGHTDRVWGLAWNPTNPSMLASCNGDKTEDLAAKYERKEAQFMVVIAVIVLVPEIALDMGNAIQMGSVSVKVIVLALTAQQDLLQAVLPFDLFLDRRKRTRFLNTHCNCSKIPNTKPKVVNDAGIALASLAVCEEALERELILSTSYIPRMEVTLSSLLKSLYSIYCKGTVVEGTIQQLFEGHHMNYIECINVDYKSTRSHFMTFSWMLKDVGMCMLLLTSMWKLNNLKVRTSIMQNNLACREMVAYIANTLIFILSGIVIAEGVLHSDKHFENEGTSWRYLILLYVFVQVSRTIVVAMLYPFLRGFGYGLDWRESIILVWSGLRGAVALALSLSVKSMVLVMDWESWGLAFGFGQT